MRLGLHNVWARVLDATGEEKTWLDHLLTYQAYGQGGQLQTYRLMDMWRTKYPAGLTAMVVRRAAEDRMLVEVVDARERPCTPDNEADVGWLRDYQLEAVEAVQRRTRGILWCPTGSGKTEIAVALTQRLPVRWLLVAHRANLVDNAAERYQLRTGCRAGVVRGLGDMDFGDGALVCATFQTLSSGLKKKDPQVLGLLQGAQGIIVDEAHTLPAATFSAVARATVNAYYRVGLSGTPLARSDARSVMTVGNMGSVIYRIQTERLIEEGVLSRPEIEAWRCEHRSQKQTWAAVYRECVTTNTQRNAMLVDMAKEAPKPAMLFVTQLKHGATLKKMLQKAGLRADYVDGKASLEQRRRAVQRLEREELDVLVATTVFSEGVDVPALRSVIMGAGGSSTIQTLQRIGRGMRTAQDKETFRVYDVDDRGQRWLERHTQARLRAYRSEGHKVRRCAPP